MKIKILLILILSLSCLLRLAWLDKFPPSLYTDEINQGYNAYSILLTGHDEHGTYLPVSLRSFGDWKPPLQTYLMIPFIYIFGLNEWSVRLPSALLGVFSVLLTYYISKAIFENNKDRNKLSLFAAFFITISPWHILQSRSAMLVMIGLFFLELGVLFFLKSLKNPKYLFISFIAFSLSVYAYYGMRIVVPLMIISYVLYFRKTLKHNPKIIFKSSIILVISLLPLLISFIKQPDVVFGRAKTVSVFYDQGVKLRQWELIVQDGINAIPVITRFFHNNVYLFLNNILSRFFSHFEGSYLFFKGDSSQPFQIPGMGILYLIDFVFIILGILSLIYQKKSVAYILFIWLFISILPASLTFMTPSANRTFSAAVPMLIFIALGLVKIGKKFGHKLTFIIIVTIYSVSFGYFLNQYFIFLPKNHSNWWNYGWKEAVVYTKSIENRYKNIVISDLNAMPYIYFLFYTKYNPQSYQQEAVRTYIADNFGFEHVDSFGKYIFIRDRKWKDLKDNILDNTLYIIPSDQTDKLEMDPHQITNPNGESVIKFFTK